MWTPPWAHVTHTCPVFLLRAHWAFVRLLASTPKEPQAYLPDSTSVVLPASGAAVAVALETDRHALTPLQPHRATVYSPSGLVLDHGQRATRDHVRLVLETMTDAMRDLTGLLVLDTLEYPSRPHPTLNPHVSAKRAQLTDTILANEKAAIHGDMAPTAPPFFRTAPMAPSFFGVCFLFIKPSVLLSARLASRGAIQGSCLADPDYALSTAASLSSSSSSSTCASTSDSSSDSNSSSSSDFDSDSDCDNVTDSDSDSASDSESD